MLDAEATMQKFIATQNRASVTPPPPENPSVVTPVEVTLEDIQFQDQEARERARPTSRGFGMADVPDLRQLVIDRVKLMGPVDAAVFFGKSLKVVRSWTEGTGYPGIKDLQQCLTRPATVQDRAAINLMSTLDIPTGDYAITQSVTRTPVQICIPVRGPVELPVAVAWVALALKQAPYFRWRADTLLVRSRNLLTQDFLSSGLPYSLWMDSDVVPPLGSPWFNEVTGGTRLGLEALNADLIPKLLAHNVDVVGGVYASRSPGQPLVIAPDLDPRGDADVDLANEIRNGTAKGLKKVRWAASGCLLISRNVFLKIQETYANRFTLHPGEPFPFWNPLPEESFAGEDVALANKILACGYDIHLDPTCVLGHLMKSWAMPSGTAAAKRLS